MALPETFIIQLFCFGMVAVTLILSDDTSFSRSWPNVKIKLMGLLFSLLGFVISINNHVYEIFTATGVIRFNQTIDLSVPSVSQAGTLDFTLFIISVMLMIISAADFVLTVMEDSPTMEELK